MVNTSSLQDDLLGVAQVAEITKTAALRLPREFERKGIDHSAAKLWGAFGGAIRVYRPNLQVTDSNFDHPLWLPREVSAPGFSDLLKSWCWSLGTLAAPSEAVSVGAIRERRRASHPAGLDASGEKWAEIYQTYLTEEQARTAEARACAETEKERGDRLAETVRALESKVQALLYQLEQKHATRNSEDSAEPPQFASLTDALEYARAEFTDTLVIPDSVYVETNEDGRFWYGILRALHYLCEAERRGDAKDKRSLLRDLLLSNVGLSKDTYKCGNTSVYVMNPSTGAKVHLRERVHLREGRPSETESIYWETVGSHREAYRYLVGRLGRHVE